MKDLIKFNGNVIPSEGFQSAAENLRAEIASKGTSEAFQVVDSAITTGVAFAHGSLLYTCYALALQKELWESMGLVEQHEIAESFYHYVGSKFGTSQNPGTVDNYIRIAKVWLLEDCIEIPEKVFYFEVDKDNQANWVVDEGGNSVEVPVSAWNTSYAKLLGAASKAAKGQMKEEDWGLLFNPDVSQGKMLSYWRGPQTPRTPNGQNGLEFYQLGKYLAVSDGQNDAAFAELDLDEIASNPLAEQGWLRLKAVMQIESGDDF